MLPDCSPTRFGEIGKAGMANQENGNADFWLKLLEEGDSDKKHNWNKRLSFNIEHIKSFFPNNAPQKAKEMVRSKG